MTDEICPFAWACFATFSRLSMSFLVFYSHFYDDMIGLYNVVDMLCLHFAI